MEHTTNASAMGNRICFACDLTCQKMRMSARGTGTGLCVPIGEPGESLHHSATYVINQTFVAYRCTGVVQVEFVGDEYNRILPTDDGHQIVKDGRVKVQYINDLDDNSATLCSVCIMSAAQNDVAQYGFASTVLYEKPRLQRLSEVVSNDALHRTLRDTIEREPVKRI